MICTGQRRDFPGVSCIQINARKIRSRCPDAAVHEEWDKQLSDRIYLKVGVGIQVYNVFAPAETQRKIGGRGFYLTYRHQYRLLKAVGADAAGENLAWMVKIDSDVLAALAFLH